nr:hypothetical protein [Lachnospiraceae bacterium]
MSFFKDFKEDLSQAVNELLPEEAVKSNAVETTETTADAGLADADIPVSDPDLTDVAAAVIPESIEPVVSEDSSETKIEIPDAFVTDSPLTDTADTASVSEPEPVSEDIVSEPEPEVSESVDTVASADDTKSAVEPVFRESSYRPAPINTTAERTS